MPKNNNNKNEYNKIWKIARKGKKKQEVCLHGWLENEKKKRRTLTVPLMPSWMAFSWHKPSSGQINEERPMRKWGEVWECFVFIYKPRKWGE